MRTILMMGATVFDYGDGKPWEALVSFDRAKVIFDRRKVKAIPARLDPNGDAKPLTRIIHHPKAGDCVAHGGIGSFAHHNPELEDNEGNRTPLTSHPVYGSFDIEGEDEFMRRP